MSFLRDMFEESRPAKIQFYRQKYNAYRTKAVDSQEPEIDFRQWLKDQGIDPDELLRDQIKRPS